MFIRRAAVAALTMLALLAPTASASNFTRMFPGEVDDPATPAAIVALTKMTNNAGPMVDPNADANQNCDRPLEVPPQDCTSAGFTYLGQFLDHDITLDRNPLPPIDQVQDPTQFNNFRTTTIDLDSVYSVGPEAFDGAKFKLGAGGRDLPRRADGTAIIGDARNDENQIIAQINVAILRLHNSFVDDQPANKPVAEKFAKAKAETIKMWREVVVSDLLPRFVGQEAMDHALKYAPEYFAPGKDPRMPVEFSSACYRFGHSLVRLAYRLAAPNGTVAAPPVGPQNIQVFNGTFGANDLTGGVPIPAARFINWPNFFQFPGELQPVNAERKFDTLLSRGLFQLPIPAAIPGGTGSLPERNIQRAQTYALPSYEDVARKVGTTPVPNPLSGFGQEMPLWYGALLESELAGGRQIGPTCGRVVSDVLVGVLKQTPEGRAAFNHPVQMYQLLNKAGVGTA